MDTNPQTSWRIRSIERFNLKPVPEAWSDAVAVGTEEAWKKYYECREEQHGEEEKANDDEDDSMDDDDGSAGLTKEWKDEMTKMSYMMHRDCKWHWTPKCGDLTWEDYDELRSAEYYCYVWSPFAIPHAIGLEHRYHNRARYSSIEFYTTWSYRLINFEDEDAMESKYTDLCSNCFEDEELRADVIETSNLNKQAVKKLRRFLFGSNTEQSKKLTCSDIIFLRLLFGSMGTTAFDGDLKRGHLGYQWVPDEKLRKKLFDEKVPADDDPDGDPPESFNDYYSSGCSWLEHRVMEITNNLGPVTKHYRPPTIKDAPGYYERDSSDDEAKY